MLKKELAATANCSEELLRRGTDSIQSVEVEIHCRASILDDHFLKCPALPLGLGNFFCTPKAFGPLAWGEAKSKNNGGAKPVSVNFDIVVGFLWLW